MPNVIDTAAGQIVESQAPALTPDLVVECRKWEQRCVDATAERDCLRAELAKTQAERDSYLKALYYYIRKETPAPTFTREEVFAAVEGEQSFGDLIADLKKHYGVEK